MFQHWSGWNWPFLVLFAVFWRRSSSETLFPRPSARLRFLALSQQVWSTCLLNTSDLSRRTQPLVKAHAVSRQSICLQSLPSTPGWQESPKIGCRTVSHASLQGLLILLSPFCNKLDGSARIILHAMCGLTVTSRGGTWDYFHSHRQAGDWDRIGCWSQLEMNENIVLSSLRFIKCLEFLEECRHDRISALF